MSSDENRAKRLRTLEAVDEDFAATTDDGPLPPSHKRNTTATTAPSSAPTATVSATTVQPPNIILRLLLP